MGMLENILGKGEILVTKRPLSWGSLKLGLLCGKRLTQWQIFAFNPFPNDKF